MYLWTVAELIKSLLIKHTLLEMAKKLYRVIVETNFFQAKVKIKQRLQTCRMYMSKSISAISESRKRSRSL